MHADALAATPAGAGPSRPFVAAVAFSTLVDLFAVQAIIPTLTEAYAVSPAEMGVAVNASTIGMAVASLLVALFARGIDRRKGVTVSLVLLAIPTALLAVAPDLWSFAVLRIAQGLCMATAFTLTLAALGEILSGDRAAGALAAYVTGNVASNLIGRLLAATAVDHAGLAGTFLLFAALNLAGAALVWTSGHHAPGMADMVQGMARPWRAFRHQIARPEILAAVIAGFCILFAFIGVFTYVNFVLTQPPLSVGMMQLGFVYFVFLPSLITTPMAAAVSSRLGIRRGFAAATAIGLVGLPLLLAPSLAVVVAGLALVGVGTFLMQAIATGYVARSAGDDRAAAGGLYLAGYFLGGLVGTAALGVVFQAAGWPATVAGAGLALLVALAASRAWSSPAAPRAPRA